MILGFLRFTRQNRIVVVALLHAAIAVVAVLLAFLLRFDLNVPASEFDHLGVLVPVLLVSRLASLWVMGVYRGSWRHAGLRDSLLLARATALGSLFALTAIVLLGQIGGMPRSVFVIETILFFGLAGGARLSARLLHERRSLPVGASRRRALIIGDGDAAERLVRQCQRESESDLHPVGLVSMQTHRGGLAIHGIPVVGPLSELSDLAQAVRADLLVIALSEASGEEMRQVIAACERTGLEFKSMPTLREVLDGVAQADEMRPIRIDDLLGRRPVQLDLGIVERDLSSAVVLVTGAAGSIGSELARQVAGFGPKTLILFDQAESPLYFLQVELARTFPALTVVPVIGDIVDAPRVDDVFALYRPDVVFHAAAYKHVPMMEFHPAEAVRNNVQGTMHVAETAVRHGARKFVLISTDKAVNPSSVMGTTKRLAELIVLGHPALVGHGTDFRAVRFGNVLGSAGSVIPLFQRQLAEGGPLTVTDPEVRRFFMTIPEAVELVLQAAALPEASNRITMLDMGQPVRIVELAEQLIRLSGKVPYRDVAITFTGLRDGEKLNEDLMSLIEESTPTAVEQIRILRTEGLEGTELETGLWRLASAADTTDSSQILRQLNALVPEYTPRFIDEAVPLTRVAELAGRVPRDRRVSPRRGEREVVSSLTAPEPRKPSIAS